jgi:hypothetical protein
LYAAAALTITHAETHATAHALLFDDPRARNLS